MRFSGTPTVADRADWRAMHGHPGRDCNEAEGVGSCVMTVNVYPATCPQRQFHGNPYRYCPVCSWQEGDDVDWWESSDSPSRERPAEDLDGFDICPEPTCSLYGKAVMADHLHLDTPAAAKRRARQSAQPGHPVTTPENAESP